MRRISTGSVAAAVLRDESWIIAARLGHRGDVVKVRLIGVGGDNRGLVATTGIRDSGFTQEVSFLVAVSVAVIVLILDGITLREGRLDEAAVRIIGHRSDERTWIGGTDPMCHLAND